MRKTKRVKLLKIFGKQLFYCTSVILHNIIDPTVRVKWLSEPNPEILFALFYVFNAQDSGFY